ncbi:MAG: DUF1178 family protein [Pseudomonadota bacterium]
MIRYALKCDREHNFDSWFQSAEAFERLRQGRHISCPICGSDRIEKSVMAPRLASSKPEKHEQEGPAHGPLGAPASPAERMIAELRKKITENSEYVGTRFADEARRIHQGDAAERSIYGEARPDEARRLIEDGVPVAPLPFMTGRRTN